MDELQAPFVIITPAFPENARTVFKGHLFVGDLLLSDSSMKNHPLTPMTDASLVRVMQAQLDPARGRRVGLIDYRVVARGAAAIAERVETLRAEGASMAIVDALNDDDLRQLARACADPAAGGGRLGVGHRHPGGARPATRRPRRATAAGRRRARGGLWQLFGGHQCAGGCLHRGRRRWPCARPAATGGRPRPGGRSAGLGAATSGQRTRAGLCHGRTRSGARGSAATGR